jgi:hypothetical protein
MNFRICVWPGNRNQDILSHGIPPPEQKLKRLSFLDSPFYRCFPSQPDWEGNRAVRLLGDLGIAAIKRRIIGFGDIIQPFISG